MPAPIFLVHWFSWLIVHGEWLCFVHVDEACLKLYPWNIVHPTLPRKYVLVYLLFCRYLLVESSQPFYILLFIVWLVFNRRWVFRLVGTVWRLVLFWSPSNWKLFASISWTKIYILPPHKRSYCLGSWYEPSSCFLAQRMISHFSFIFFVCVKQMQWFF